MEPYTLLIIARTQSLAKRLRGALAADEYVIRWAASSTEGLALETQPSLLVIELPPSGGTRCIARLKRRFDSPILALVRVNQVVPEEVDALLPRPCRPDELVDSIEALLIRHSPHMICIADMSLDPKSRRLQVNGTLRQLRPIACQILAVLMSKAGQTVPRDELFRRIWHTTDGDNTRALDVHIAYLRREMEADPSRPRIIVTERGIGYRLQVSD